MTERRAVKLGKTIIHEDIGKRFVNPYNFIPLAGKCQRKRPERDEQNCYTGYFECSMRLLTPLFIPNTSSSVRLLQKKEEQEGEEKKKKYGGYDFFSYEDYSKEGPYIDKMPLPPSNPVIPGSEIRGALRSVFEAAFNGCMSSVEGDRDLSRRCAEIKKPGVLSWDKNEEAWILKECKKARVRVQQKIEKNYNEDQWKWVDRESYEKLSEGQSVQVRNKYDMNTVKDFRVFNSGKKPYGKWITGFLHKGEYIDDKKCEYVFYRLSDEKITVYDEDVELLKRVWLEYKKNGKAQEEEWYKEFDIKPDGSKILVYYSIEKENNKNKNQNKQKHVYMSPACIGREAFGKQIESLLKNNGGYQPCSDENLCPACRIFGMMDKSEKPRAYAYGSKVRITDATLINPVKNSADLFEKPVVLPEMGEPSPSAVEFYTESPYDSNQKNNEQNYWTYDYKYIKKSKDPKEREVLGESQPKIRGRKYYWHKDVDLNEFKGNKVSAMQQRIRPLKPNKKSDLHPTFQFRVYFEQLNKKQLEQLKWSLDLGNPDCAHKIGRGKPLGFGSVQIRVESLYTRNIDEKTGKRECLTIGDHREVSFEKFFKGSGFSSKEIPEELKIMSNWEMRPSNVSYPLGEDKNDGEKVNAKASHQWFRLNRMEKKWDLNEHDTQRDNFNHNFSKLLPTAAEDADETLDQKKALYKLVKKKE